MSQAYEGQRLPRWARKRPPMAGRALADGFGPPAGTKGKVTAWQGHLPLPHKRKGPPAYRMTNGSGIGASEVLNHTVLTVV